MWEEAFLLLLVVGTAGAAYLSAAIALLRRRLRPAKVAAMAGATLVVIYSGFLVGAAAAGPHHTLGLGEEKYICELDCHLSYSVVAVQREGRQVRIRLNVRFDETTTSTRRPKDLALAPGPRSVQLRDRRGARHRPVNLGDLYRALLPGEAYETELVFDVDPAAAGLILYIADADPVKWALIGSENNPLRRPVGFRLTES